MDGESTSTRRTALKTLGTGAVALAGFGAASQPAAALYSHTGTQWTQSDDYHVDSAHYPTAIGGETMPVNSTIDIAVEKTGEEVESTPVGDVRIHDLDIEVLLTSEYVLWDGKHAQQMQEVSVSLDGRDGADVQVWEDGDIGTVISGPARDASEIDETADQIENSDAGFDDTIVALSQILVGRTSKVGSVLLEAASLADAIINNGTADDSKTYRWDYSVPLPAYEYLNPQQPEYHSIDQTYAATIYLTDIRLGIPVDEGTGTLRIEPKITGYGLNSTLTYDMVVGNDPDNPNGL